MSYYDEIINLGKTFNSYTVVIGDSITEDSYSNTDKSIWTAIGRSNISFSQLSKKCCLDKTKRKRCIINLKRAIKNNEQGIIHQYKPKEYSWSQYDISIFCKGNILDENNIIGGAVITRPIILKNHTGSIARLSVSSTGSNNLNISVNGNIVGNITFLPNSNSGDILFYNDIELKDGDVISIVSTNIFDSLAQDYFITLSGIAQDIEVWDIIT